MQHVVYAIRNTANQKLYVGSSERGLGNRRSHHLKLLRQGRHYSKSLQADWKRFGEAAFIFEILEIVDVSDLIRLSRERLRSREQYWSDESKCCEPAFGYSSRRNVRHNGGCAFYKSATHRAKMSKAGARADQRGKKIAVQARINQGLTQAKLTTEQVIAIRKRLARGERQRVIAIRFKVSQQTICNIANNRGLVYGGISRMDYRPNPKAPITASEVARVKELFATGMQQRKIAKEIGRSNSAVNRIVLGR